MPRLNTTKTMVSQFVVEGRRDVRRLVLSPHCGRSCSYTAHRADEILEEAQGAGRRGNYRRAMTLLRNAFKALGAAQLLEERGERD